MAFGPAEMAAVALGAIFRDQIGAMFCWPFKMAWRGLLFICAPRRESARNQRGANMAAPVADIIDVTPVSSRFTQ